MRIIKVNSKKWGSKDILIDDNDYFLLSLYKWCLSKRGRSNEYFYATTTNRPRLMMHHILMGKEKGMVVDHIDGNGLNNQRNNLRICKQHGNILNSSIRSDNTTGFKGVFRLKHCTNEVYHAYININGKRIPLGCHYNKIDAAKAYNEAALIHHGEFAKLNPI